MYQSKLIIGIVFSVTVLAILSFFPQIEAKPINSNTAFNGVDFSCSTSKGILSCSMQSSSGGKVGDARMMEPDPVTPIICDEDTHQKKRLSISNRNSASCTEPFIQGSLMRLVVRYVDGVDTETLQVSDQPIICIANSEGSLSFVISSNLDCSQ